MNNIKLHPVTHPKNRRLRNRYCGPGALSILTGVNTQQASRIIREHTGQRACTGVSTRGLLASLKTMGFGFESFVQMDGGCTLHQLVTQLMTPDLVRGRTFLVIAGNHFQIIQDDLFADNQNDGPIFYSDLGRGKRRRVEEVFELFLLGEVTVPTYMNSPKPSWKTLRTKCRRLARALSVSLDTDGFSEEYETIWTWADNEPEDWEDNHYVYGWEELWNRLTAYKAFIS